MPLKIVLVALIVITAGVPGIIACQLSIPPQQAINAGAKIPH